MSGFKRAVREARPLRLAIYGPSNSGKTFTALTIAQELGGKVALIDTERSSSSTYAEDFKFDNQSLTTYAHTDYIAMIDEAREHDVLIIDGISHAWEGKGGILELVDTVVAGQNKGDSFRAWGDPRVKNAQEKLWSSILDFPGHVIVTMRAKTAYERSTDANGKAKIEKLGLAPIQRSGVEFEFDVIAEMDKEHYLFIDKARDPGGTLEGQRIHKPGVKFAQKLKKWLDAGSSPAEDYGKRIAAACEEISKLMDEPIEEVKLKTWDWIKIHFDTDNLANIPNEDLAQIPGKLLETFGPGTPEEQRQSRMADREAEVDNAKAQSRNFIGEAIEKHGLDEAYIWEQLRERCKSGEPDMEELEYFSNHITKHPDLWVKPKEAKSG